ncbi:L-fucose:H+ symporter permease [Tessaracoccus antarcticus]|uniref:L-fucose:H+ symporter permease n=1 Tax=Tessaracoccus antarcticus TaxID=2479848 RepID=A0A3M0G2Z4_9ACTN|nr:L-fucose:H+ symporter permease [Tessaracoccus antarcticus]RMB58918.1 L-fucose:H+ symporter permease [Tessaracoccus antarcticus]
MLVPFILLILCFAAWGAAANLTDVLVGVFRGIFDMTNFQSSLVQFAYYGAYFLLALPAAFITSRYGYKVGVLTGLGLAAVGGVLFVPASKALVYGFFLLALFTLAAGLSILETSANPFVIALGSEETATQRLNLAQAFNPVGANVGVLMGAILILPGLTSEASKTIMSPDELLQSQEADLSLVLNPYLGIAAVLVIIWLLIAFRKIPILEQPKGDAVPVGNVATRLWHNRHYRYGVVAQFFNVAAQTCTWTFTILYAQDVVGISEKNSGWFLQASLIVFLIARFVMVWLLGIFRPTKLLLIMAVFGVACCLIAMFSLNIVGLIAVVAISAALSLMFPTIYGVALSGLGEDAKFGAAGLVMAILGGALLPMVHALVMDVGSPALGYVVPGVCLAFVAAYALFDLRTSRDPKPSATSAVVQ